MDGPSIGYIPHTDSVKTYLQSGEVPTQTLEPVSLSIIQEYGPVFFFTVAVAIYVELFWHYLLDKFHTPSDPNFIGWSICYFVAWLFLYFVVIWPIIYFFFTDSPQDEPVADASKIDDGTDNAD